MKQYLATICIFGFLAVAATAPALEKEATSVDAVFEDQVKQASEEALLVGEILRLLPEGVLDHDVDLSETDEYFVRAFVEKVKSATKNATLKVKEAAKDAFTEAKQHVKAAAKEAKEKATAKVLEIISKIFSKFTDKNEPDDSDTSAYIVMDMASEYRRYLERLIKERQSQLKK